jgi:type IV pilus assembly protein PilE
MHNRQAAFTLIEIMIALTIVAILAAVSMVIYSSQVRKGRRTDGISALLGMSLAQERYRATHTSYGTLAQVWGGIATSSQGFYALSISNVSASTYTLTATAQGDQANDAVSGTACSSLQISFSNGNLTKTPSACWPT